MSDSENEQLSAEEIVQNLKNASKDLKDVDDYLSYATLIDIYLSEPAVFTDEEKSTILIALAEIFEGDIEIVRQIGWDLPELLLRFFNLHWKYDGPLRTAPAIGHTMRVFDIVARNGNPKELFIKAIELLGNIEFDEDPDRKTEVITDLTIHTLIELLSSSLKRINTLYPSKFLGMAVSALLKLMSTYIKFEPHVRIVTRRLYSFARDYIPPQKPLNYIEEQGITQEEADKIDEDEAYLQRVLLQSFLSNVILISVKRASFEFSLAFYRNLQIGNKGLPREDHSKDEEDIGSSRDLLSRTYTLLTSYDTDVYGEFNKIRKDSVKLFENIDPSKSEEDKVQDLFKISINDTVSSLFHPESQSIPLSVQGILISAAFASSDTSEKYVISVSEAVALTIRILSPTLLAEKYKHVGVFDSILYWNWFSVVKSRPSDYENIPTHQIILYLQILVYYSSTTPDPRFRLATFTLLTKVLTLIDEKTSYDFIIDTLATAPFENAKSGMTYVLKDLIIRTRPSNVGDLTLNLSQIQVKSEAATVSPPPLPKRHYIELNSDRIADIYALIRESVDNSFHEGAGFQTLLGYLNLLIGVKGKFPDDKVREIIDATNKKIVEFKKVSDSKENSAVDLVSLSLERLQS